MKPNGQQLRRRLKLKPILAFGALLLIALLPLRAQESGSTNGADNPDAATREALQRAREQLKQAERAADEAAAARSQSREAMRQAAEAYEQTAAQQEQLLEQLRSLSAALNAYAGAVDRLVERGISRRPATASSGKETGSAQNQSKPDQDTEPQTASAEGSEMQSEDSGTADGTAMQDESGSDQQAAGEQQRDASEGEEPATVAKRSDEERTPDEPSGDASADTAIAEEPAEVAEGPIAPEAQVFNALWNPELTDEEVAQKIVGPTAGQNACANCHTLESSAWQHSRHQTSFQDRHRSDEARQILRNLDQRSMKFRNESCRDCHYTSTEQRGRLQPIAGISCESCHGPAKEWIDIHNRLAGKPDGEVLDWGTDRESEAQREARLEKSREKGMIHSGMIYAMAANCVRCHAVPNEQIVNEGEHPAGSDFELVSWSQGEVRHNFLSSPGAPDDPSNAEASPERRRRLYVVGRVADLEHTLRNLVEVENNGGAFHMAMIKRARRLRGALAEIVGSADIPELAHALKQVPDTIGTSTTIPESLPEVLRTAGRRFAARYAGEELQGIDSLIPSERKGEPYRASQ